MESLLSRDPDPDPELEPAPPEPNNPIKNWYSEFFWVVSIFFGDGFWLFFNEF